MAIGHGQRALAGAGLSIGAAFALAADAQAVVVSNTANSGGGSLRDAIDAANVSASDEAITFASGLTARSR